MGSTKDVMKLFAERDLRQHFSAFNGWTIAQINGAWPDAYFYKVARGKWAGVEEAFIAVSFSQVPYEEVISALDQITNGPLNHPKKYLLTPKATDISSVPPHITVLPMNAFAYAGKELVWLTKKKNAMRYTPKDCSPAPATVKQE